MTPTPKTPTGRVPDRVRISPAEQKAEKMAQQIDLVVGGREHMIKKGLARHFERCLRATV